MPRLFDTGLGLDTGLCGLADDLLGLDLFDGPVYALVDERVFILWLVRVFAVE